MLVFYLADLIFPAQGGIRGGEMDYWINSSGEAKGPYTYRQLVSMWGCGALTADTSYYDAFVSSWRPLRLILESGLPPVPEGVQLPPTPPPEVGRRIEPDSDNLFTFTGRWDRSAYVVALVGYTSIFFVLCWVLRPADTVHTWGDVPGGYFIIVPLWLYLMTCAAVKRMHDINWSAWGIIVLPAMFTWLFLALIGGNDGPNLYGNKP